MALSLRAFIGLLLFCVGSAWSVSDTTGAWMVRDVHADSDFMAADASGDVPGMGLRLETIVAEGAVPAYTCTVVDTTGGERAVTLARVITVDARGWRWWDDARRSREIQGSEPFSNLTVGFYGTTLMASRYPLAVIDDGVEGLCMAVPPDPGRAVRFVYEPATTTFRAEFDFGLSPLTQQFPSSADATVLAYTVPSEWAFRQALATYYETHGTLLVRRAGQGGTLLRGSALDTIANPEDFGFAWHDFAAEYVSVRDWARIDEALGVSSFLYREPQTHWRSLRGPLSGQSHTTFDDGTLGELSAVGAVTVFDGHARIPTGGALTVPGFPTAENEDLEAEFTLHGADQILVRNAFDLGWQGRFWCGIRKTEATEGVPRVGAFDFSAQGRQDGELMEAPWPAKVTIKMVVNRGENLTRVYAAYGDDARQGQTPPRLHLVGYMNWGNWTGEESASLHLRNYAPVPMIVDDVIITRFSGPNLDPTYETYFAQLQEDAQRGDEESRATLVSGAWDKDARYNLYLGSIQWTQSVPFGVNPAPGVLNTGFPGWPDKKTFEWSVFSRLLGWDGTPSLMEGSYFDSLQGWGNVLNYRREHWKTSSFPLTFDRNNSNALCLLNIWGNVAHARALVRELHGHGQLLAGNDAWFQVWYHMPFIDVPGREISNYSDGQWSPPGDDTYLYFRSIAGKRPFWTLMNDNFDDGSHMEEYFQRSLFYGICPSMYHAHDGASAWYWAEPDYYDRDRALFLKYVPLIRRVDSAGWEPVPHAAVLPDLVLLERFGRAADGNLAYTLHNPGAAPVDAVLTLRPQVLGIERVTGAREWIGDTALDPAGGAEGGLSFRVQLDPGGFAAVGVDTVPADTTPPELTCPPDQVAGLGRDCRFELGDLTSLAEATDDRTSSPVVSQQPPPGAVLGPDAAVVTLTAEDEAGNTADCTFQVTAEDPRGLCSGTRSHHTADYDQNQQVGLAELLRVIQFYNGSQLCCADPPESTEDGYRPGAGPLDCMPHDSDYAPEDWRVNAEELLRAVQLYAAESYHACAGTGTEDSFCLGSS